MDYVVVVSGLHAKFPFEEKITRGELERLGLIKLSRKDILAPEPVQSGQQMEEKKKLASFETWPNRLEVNGTGQGAPGSYLRDDEKSAAPSPTPDSSTPVSSTTPMASVESFPEMQAVPEGDQLPAYTEVWDANKAAVPPGPPQPPQLVINSVQRPAPPLESPPPNTLPNMFQTPDPPAPPPLSPIQALLRRTGRDMQASISVADFDLALESLVDPTTSIDNRKWIYDFLARLPYSYESEVTPAQAYKKLDPLIASLASSSATRNLLTDTALPNTGKGKGKPTNQAGGSSKKKAVDNNNSKAENDPVGRSLFHVLRRWMKVWDGEPLMKHIIAQLDGSTPTLFFTLAKFAVQASTDVGTREEPTDLTGGLFAGYSGGSEEPGSGYIDSDPDASIGVLAQAATLLVDCLDWMDKDDTMPREPYCRALQHALHCLISTVLPEGLTAVHEFFQTLASRGTEGGNGFKWNDAAELGISFEPLARDLLDADLPGPCSTKMEELKRYLCRANVNTKIAGLERENMEFKKQVESLRAVVGLLGKVAVETGKIVSFDGIEKTMEELGRKMGEMERKEGGGASSSGSRSEVLLGGRFKRKTTEGTVAYKWPTITQLLDLVPPPT